MTTEEFKKLTGAKTVLWDRERIRFEGTIYTIYAWRGKKDKSRSMSAWGKPDWTGSGYSYADAITEALGGCGWPTVVIRDEFRGRKLRAGEGGPE